MIDILLNKFSRGSVSHDCQWDCGVFSPRLMEVFRKVRPQFEKLAISE